MNKKEFYELTKNDTWRKTAPFFKEKFCDEKSLNPFDFMRD